MACSRRQVLYGIGAAAALAGCGGPAGDGLTVDAPAGTSCGTNMICLDLTQGVYAALATVGGFVRVSTPHDLIIVIRVSATTFDALSDICTHAGCALGYTASTMRIVCGCHGSQFTLTGAVAKGPALQPLRVYTTSFDAMTNIVTVTTA